MDTEEQRGELDELPLNKQDEKECEQRKKLYLKKLRELKGVRKRTIDDDNTGAFTLTVNDGNLFLGFAMPTSKKHLKAEDAKGNELFDGSVDTKKQREKLNDLLINKLKELEGKFEDMAKSEGSIKPNRESVTPAPALPSSNQ